MSALRIDGAAVASALGGRRGNGGWMFHCPCHDDKEPSASVRDDGLVTCFAGCDRYDVISELRRLGFATGGKGRRERRMWRIRSRSTPRQPTPEEIAARNADICRAQAIWDRSVHTREGAAAYLRSRGITLPVPPCVVGHANGITVAVQNLSGELIAVQIKERGKKGITYGRMEDGAVLLADMATCPDNDGLFQFGLAEGVETALSAAQITGVPCWAVLGAGRLDKLQLPRRVGRLFLFADNDEPGRRAAARAFARFHDPAFREVITRYPPGPHKDWNDFLQEGGGHG